MADTLDKNDMEKKHLKLKRSSQILTGIQITPGILLKCRFWISRSLIQSEVKFLTSSQVMLMLQIAFWVLRAWRHSIVSYTYTLEKQTENQSPSPHLWEFSWLIRLIVKIRRKQLFWSTWISTWYTVST